MTQQEEKNTLIIDGEGKKAGRKKPSTGIFVTGGLLAVATAIVAGFTIISSVGGNDERHKPKIHAAENPNIRAAASQHRRDKQHIARDIADVCLFAHIWRSRIC